LNLKHLDHAPNLPDVIVQNSLDAELKPTWENLPLMKNQTLAKICAMSRPPEAALSTTCLLQT